MNNPAYSEFASVYDELMTEIPYDAYVDIIDEASGGMNGKQILDIGCGTGLIIRQTGKDGSERNRG